MVPSIMIIVISYLQSPTQPQREVRTGSNAMYHGQETVYCRGLVRPLLPLHCLTALLLHCAVNIYSSTECLVPGKHDLMIMGIVTTLQ